MRGVRGNDTIMHNPSNCSWFGCKLYYDYYYRPNCAIMCSCCSSMLFVGVLIDGACHVFIKRVSVVIEGHRTPISTRRERRAGGNINCWRVRTRNYCASWRRRSAGEMIEQ